MQIITKQQLGTKLMLSNYRHERMKFFLIGANPFNGLSCFLLSGPTLKRQISDNDGILHSCLWSIQNFKSNSICLGSVKVGSDNQCDIPSPNGSCHSDICQFEPLAYKLEIHTWPTSSL